MVVGRPFVDQDGGASITSRGIYYKNYLEIAKREKGEKLKNSYNDDCSL